ncbi:hypothetical protein PR048_028160 [Dryococelus australis]|uniref:Ribosomal protein S4 n=1 Tax=Dryococelus australis TaxID=614101 RepID=A0ABQ9GIH2_9NEOP|nr:hypothetical protein PR048_028160 [Dryococelus australis]
MQIFQYLYDMGTKNEQDIFLSSLIEPQEIKRRRPKHKKFVYKYFILVNCQRSEVYKRAFVKRLRRLQSYILQDKTLKDMRGIGNTNRALPNKDVLLLNEHIFSFPDSVTLLCEPPQIDTFVKCEELMVRLKHPSLNVVTKRVAAAELQIHKRINKKYFNKMKATREECQNNPELLGLCFDYFAFSVFV